MYGLLLRHLPLKSILSSTLDVPSMATEVLEAWKYSPTLMEYIFDRLGMLPDRTTAFYMHLNESAQSAGLSEASVYKTFSSFFADHTNGWQRNYARLFIDELAAGQELVWGNYAEFNVVQFRNGINRRNFFFSPYHAPNPVQSSDFGMDRNSNAPVYHEVQGPKNFDPSLLQEHVVLTGLMRDTNDLLFGGIWR